VYSRATTTPLKRHNLKSKRNAARIINKKYKKIHGVNSACTGLETFAVRKRRSEVSGNRK